MADFVAFPIPNQPISVGSRLAGNGTSATPIDVPDEAIDDDALALVPTATIKGRVAGGTGKPKNLSKAEAQGLLSVDDIITLSGVADGAANLGTFTGTTIPDNTTIKAALQSLETAVEAVPGGGSSLTNDTETSGVNPNNRCTVRYETVSGTPVVDVVWTGEGGASPTVSINVSGGVILVKKVFNTYENTDSTSRNLDITINGVGSQMDMAVPICQKAYHQFDFDTVSPSGQLYLDNDNTPQIQPYGFVGTSPGQISIRITNIPSSERYGLNMIWQ